MGSTAAPYPCRWCSARHPRAGCDRGSRVFRRRTRGSGRVEWDDVDADPARRRDLPGERLVRSLLRHLPERRQHRRPTVPRRPAARRRSTGSSGALLTANPNGVNPRRYDATQIGDVLTCDQDHNYTDEQQAFDAARWTASRRPSAPGRAPSPTGAPCVAGDVMNYYDGNTDHGAVELRAAVRDERQLLRHAPSAHPRPARSTSRPATPAASTWRTPRTPRRSPPPPSPNADLTADGQGGYSLTSDAQPYWDDCSTRDAVAMSGHQHRRRAQRRAACRGAGSKAASGRPRASPTPPPRPGTPVRRPRPSSPTSSRRPVSTAACRTRRTRASATPSTPIGAGLSGALAYRHRPVRLQGRLHPAPPAVRVLRLDREPASRDACPTASSGK